MTLDVFYSRTRVVGRFRQELVLIEGGEKGPYAFVSCPRVGNFSLFSGEDEEAICSEMRDQEVRPVEIDPDVDGTRKSFNTLVEMADSGETLFDKGMVYDFLRSSGIPIEG